MRESLTYGNVVATPALFLALSGGVYGARRDPPSSVGSRQLKSGAVTKGKVADGAVTGAFLLLPLKTGEGVRRKTVPVLLSALLGLLAFARASYALRGVRSSALP